MELALGALNGCVNNVVAAPEGVEITCFISREGPMLVPFVFDAVPNTFLRRTVNTFLTSFFRNFHAFGVWVVPAAVR